MRCAVLVFSIALIFVSSAASAEKGDLTQTGLQAPPLMMIEDAKSQFHLGNKPEAAKDLGSAASLMRL